MTRTPAAIPIDHVAVVIPAADEQDRIAACLHAVSVAVRQLRRHPTPSGGAVDVDVLVVLDACTDRTAEIVAGFPDVRSLSTDRRCVGAARDAGTRNALARGGRSAHSWTAHTDADSQVPPHWLVEMLAAARAGYQLVLGTVHPDEELPESALRAWQSRNPAGDGHPYVHGANLGVAAGVLHALGGWRALPTGEDVDLAARAEARGVPILRTAGIGVRTSARPDGRAPRGFSSYLRALAADPADPRNDRRHPTNGSSGARTTA